MRIYQNSSSSSCTKSSNSILFVGKEGRLFSLLMRATAAPKPFAAVMFMDLSPPPILNLVCCLRIGIGLGFMEAICMTLLEDSFFVVLGSSKSDSSFSGSFDCLYSVSHWAFVFLNMFYIAEIDIFCFLGIPYGYRDTSYCYSLSSSSSMTRAC